MKDLIKRYTPLSAIGTFFCSHCIVDSAKNILAMEKPELMQVATHDKKKSEDLNVLALQCMAEILAKYQLNTSLFALDAMFLLNHSIPGTIFVGARTDTIGDTETKMDFFERIKNEIVRLELMKNKVDEDMSEGEVEHYHEMFEMQYLSDIVVTLSQRLDEDDVDDLDIGYEKGMMDGMDGKYYTVQVALYKMFKKKKIKDLDFILEEIHNTIHGMDGNDFKIWSKNFKKYTSKKLKKEQNIEGDNI